uniref:Uncharacterized protein n=1 Tax=Arundo donax TaxID=35708 RepID=A0A0A9DN04_ARUDO
MTNSLLMDFQGTKRTVLLLRMLQKFLLHSCYSLIVLRKRWKDVFWGAIREELMITLKLSGKGSKFLLNLVCLSLSITTQKTRLKRLMPQPIPEVFEDVKAIFAPYAPKAE